MVHVADATVARVGAPIEVCIVSYDSADVIGGAIRSAAMHIPNVRVAVREHGPTGSGAALAIDVAAELGIDLRVESMPANPGFGSGCNALAATSEATWLLFLNPDAIILRWPFSDSSHPEFGTIVGAWIEGNGRPDRHFGVRWSTREEIRRSWFRRGGPEPSGRGFVSGAALLTDRSSFLRIGGFDDGYFMYFEDIDLCFRANHEGLTTMVDHRFVVEHGGAHSTAGRFGAALEWSFRSGVRFRRSHGGSRATYRVYVVVDSVARAVHAAIHRRWLRARAYLRLAVLAVGPRGAR